MEPDYPREPLDVFPSAFYAAGVGAGVGAGALSREATNLHLVMPGYARNELDLPFSLAPKALARAGLFSHSSHKLKRKVGQFL